MPRELPAWVYKDRKPETDHEYFENLTRIVFEAGMSWRIIANKWPNFGPAFSGFDIDVVAAYGAEDIKRLKEDASIIRNSQKINATIQNAREFQRIQREHGSFKAWLESQDKSNNYDRVVKALRSRLKRVGPSTAHIFLWSVGEPIQHDPSVFTRKPKEIV
jgi:DNA-3-methyladenine glycosylase I